MTLILDGRAVAAAIETRLAASCATLTAAGTIPTLAVVTATDDPAGARWTRTLRRAADRVGIRCLTVAVDPQAPATRIRSALTDLSADPRIHGIVLQTPLSDRVVLETVTDAITVGKDIDGANPLSSGRLGRDLPAFAPAIARAVVTLLNHHTIPISDRRIVVVGRSSLVGKPTADLLLTRNATVTICHRHTNDLAEITRSADIVVTAAGHPGLITDRHVHPGTVLIDVGLTITSGGHLIGDVDGAAVHGLVHALSPVPGGVGRVSTTVLLDHTLRAASAA